LIAKVLTSITMLLSLTLVPPSAYAYSECQGVPNWIWTGDNGNVSIALDIGTVFVVFPNDLDTKNILATAALAMAIARPVRVRFAADGVPCSSAALRTDVVGMYAFR
jgi:hypothetical protein